MSFLPSTNLEKPVSKEGFDPFFEVTTINDQWVVPKITFTQSSLIKKNEIKNPLNGDNIFRETNSLTNIVFGSNHRNLFPPLNFDTYLLYLKLLTENKFDEVNSLIGTNINFNEHTYNQQISTAMELDSKESIGEFLHGYSDYYLEILLEKAKHGYGAIPEFLTVPNAYPEYFKKFSNSSQGVIKYLRPMDDDNTVYVFMPKYNNHLIQGQRVFKLDSDTFELVRDLFTIKTFPQTMYFILVSKFLYINPKKKMYTKFFIQEPNKKREINAPDDDLKEACRELNRVAARSMENKLNVMTNKEISKGLRRHVEPLILIKDTLMAYRYKRGIKDNAKFHAEMSKVTGGTHIIKLDIKHFFDSCSLNYIQRTMDYLLSPYKIPASKYYTKDVFKDICEKVLVNPESNGFYMGNPLSGTLSNTVMIPVVKYVNSIISKYGIAMTIYADDMTFSQAVKFNDDGVHVRGSRTIKEEDFKKYFNHKYLAYVFNTVVKQLGFTSLELKDEKTLVQRKQKRRVTGVTINSDNQTTWSRDFYRKVRYILFTCDKYNQDLSYFGEEKSKMRGNIEFYLSVDEKGKMKTLLDKYSDTAIRLGFKSDPKEIETDSKENNGGFFGDEFIF